MPPMSMSTALDIGKPMIDAPSHGEWESTNWSRRYGSMASRSQPRLVMITNLLLFEGTIYRRQTVDYRQIGIVARLLGSGVSPRLPGMPERFPPLRPCGDLLQLVHLGPQG
jgi:hypothetical protein